MGDVLRGDMALVGPGPERPCFVNRLTAQVPRYTDRHRLPVVLTPAGGASAAELAGPVNITDDGADDFEPNRSPDGTQIAFDPNRDGDNDLYVLTPPAVPALTDGPLWWEDAVTWMVANSNATGDEDGTFRPNLPITRGQDTRVLDRVEGPPPGAPAHSFTDVAAWLTESVDWIVDPAHDPPDATGHPGGLDRPDWNITRAQTTRMTCGIDKTGGTC